MSSCATTPQPVTELSSSFGTYTTKKANSLNKTGPRPPKLNVKKRTRCSLFKSSNAKEISFSNNNNVSNLSQLYDEGNTQSYFDQCYENICKIGEGSFGEVYKVRSKDDGKHYAVKRTRKARLDEVRRFEQIPPHNNCVRFHHAWEQGDLIYMQMELCGISLESYTQTVHAIPEEKVWEMFLDLALAVKNMHNHNLIHLDIKPANIMLGTNNQCKLGDFGLAFDLTQGNIKDAAEGDSKYIAPELMKGKFGKAADIFSLGITIFELASDLDLPQCGPLWQMLRAGKLPEDMTKTISKDLLEIIRKMMAPCPADRPTADDLVKHSRLRLIAAKRLGTFFFNRMTGNMINAYAWFINKFWTSTTFMYLSMNYICKAMRMVPNSAQPHQQPNACLVESHHNDDSDNSDLSDALKPLRFDIKRPRITISTPVQSTPIRKRFIDDTSINLLGEVNESLAWSCNSHTDNGSQLATNLFLQTPNDIDDGYSTPLRIRDNTSQPVFFVSAKKLKFVLGEDSD